MRSPGERPLSPLADVEQSRGGVDLERGMKTACAQCGTIKWGLIRWRWHQRQFCSKACRDRFLDELVRERDRLRRWLGYLDAA
jgi:hypothetical protein